MTLKGYNALRYANHAVLWLNGRLSRRRSAMVPSDRALATSYRLYKWPYLGNGER